MFKSSFTCERRACLKKKNSYTSFFPLLIQTSLHKMTCNLENSKSRNLSGEFISQKEE